MIKAVLFDHDGLLVETELLFFEVTNQVLREKGIEISREDWSREYLSLGCSSAQMAVARGYPKAQLDAFISSRNGLYRERLRRDPPLYPATKEVLQELKQSYCLALVTGNSREAIETVHEKTGILGLFDLVLTQENFAQAKPRPDGYLEALKRLKLPASSCVAVEDSERGMQAALAAEIRCITIPGVLTRDQRFIGALFVLESLRDLPVTLRTLNG